MLAKPNLIPYSESLLSELDPLELLLPDSEELLLLSREGPPGGAVPDFSGGDAAGERNALLTWLTPLTPTRSTTPSSINTASAEHPPLHTPPHAITHPLLDPVT